MVLWASGLQHDPFPPSLAHVLGSWLGAEIIEGEVKEARSLGSYLGLNDQALQAGPADDGVLVDQADRSLQREILQLQCYWEQIMGD